MPPKEFILSFTGLSSETRTAIAHLTTQELKRRGCEIEADSKGAAEAVVFAVKSNSTEASQDLRAAVEVEIGNADSSNSVNDQHQTVTKIVVPSDADHEQYIAVILSRLEGLELIARAPSENSSYDEDDEAVIRSRLESLGYL